MFMYGLCKQNYPSVMEEVHRSIDCENGRNNQKSLSYRGQESVASTALRKKEKEALSPRWFTITRWGLVMRN